MNERLAAQEIYDQAALWAARVDAGPLDAEEQAALDRWVEADSRHFGAFAQASAHLVPLSAAERPAAGTGWSRRQTLMTGSIAAGLAVLGVAGSVGLRLLSQQRYGTRLGEMRVIPLNDGSVISLNTNSEIVVNYSRSLRAIDLVEGEALFDVAKNKARPFIVRAGDTQVRAVGTSFTVRNLPGQPVKVLVREGLVEVTRPHAPVAPAVRLAANHTALAPSDAPIIAHPVATDEVSRELAWRVGRLAFHGETLGEAAQAFARYSDIRIRIDDPAVASQRVAGLFVSADPVGFSKAVASSFDLHVQIGNSEVVLSR